MTPNDHYSGRTAPLTSKRCVLYIYSTNIGTEYFKHSIYSKYFPLQNAVCFIILTYLIPVLLSFYIQDVLKLKKIIPAPKVLYICCVAEVTECYTYCNSTGWLLHLLQLNGMARIKILACGFLCTDL